MFGRKKRDASTTGDDTQGARSSSDRTLTNDFEPTKAQIKRATRPRFVWDLITSLLLLISVIFIILVQVGNIGDIPVARSTHFITLDLRNVIPTSVPNSVLINSIAQTIGLHDYYWVGLWNFCEGNQGEGIDYCSPTETLYWFNPLAIIRSELLAGASIALPARVSEILDLLRIVSHWMFGLFLSGACVEFIMIFLTPLTVYSRWLGLIVMIFVFLGALFTIVATVIATVLFIIMQNAITAVAEINIEAHIGTQMFAFMWTAAATAFLAFLIQLGQCCCCATRRDVKKGKKKGSKKAWDTETPGISDSASEKPKEKKKGWFGRKK